MEVMGSHILVKWTVFSQCKELNKTIKQATDVYSWQCRPKILGVFIILWLQTDGVFKSRERAHESECWQACSFWWGWCGQWQTEVSREIILVSIKEGRKSPKTKSVKNFYFWAMTVIETGLPKSSWVTLKTMLKDEKHD